MPARCRWRRAPLSASARISAAIMTANGMPLIAGLGVAVVLCFAIGWILGYPALRVQHHYLAFVTLTFHARLPGVPQRRSPTASTASATFRPTILGYPTNQPLPFYYVCLGSLALVSLANLVAIRSPWGRAFVALRENPVRALSTRHRYAALHLDGVCDRLGARRPYPPLISCIKVVPFNLSLSLDLLMMVIVGGSVSSARSWAR